MPVDTLATNACLDGDYYYTNMQWYNITTGESLPDKPIPQYYLDRQTPPEEFVVSEGNLIVEATDGSKIIANFVSNDGETISR